jgi:signal transduction histidine kinase
MGWPDRLLHGRRVPLRTVFLLVVLLAVILPLALLGFRLATSTQRSAEALVRSRVERSLAGIVHGTGGAWAEHRSAILHLADAEAVRHALRTGARLDIGADHGGGDAPGAGHAVVDGVPDAVADRAPYDVSRQWAVLEGVVQRAVLRDTSGAVVGVLERPMAPHRGFEPSLLAALVSVRIPVHAPGTGERLGSLDAGVRAGAILPGDALGPGVTGSILALFDPADGSPLLPLAMEPALFAQNRFRWAEDTWVVARHRMYDPPLVLVLAGPVGDYVGPFEAAAREGLALLLLVTAAAVFLTVFASRRLTRPLDDLAAAAADVAGGRLDRRAPERGPDEVFRVARAFNEMTASLRATLDRLSQREAVAAVGELAASVAHEVRNPLTAVHLNLERAGEALDPDHPAADWIDSALRDVERLDASVGDLLHLARSGKVDLAPIFLAAPVGDAMAAAAHRFASRSAVLEPPDETRLATTVMGDANALTQLFLNLFLNAAEALPEGGRAGVTIRIDQAQVSVGVWDQGEGMDAAVRDRVLEPFFSTKTDGTGLGLAIASRIALAHGGDLTVESEPGQGTTMTVTLRRADMPALPSVPGGEDTRDRSAVAQPVPAG